MNAQWHRATPEIPIGPRNGRTGVSDCAVDVMVSEKLGPTPLSMTKPPRAVALSGQH